MKSLAKLGISITRAQLIGLLASVIAGLIVARAMPFIYPIIFSRALDFVFGPGPSTVRDNFNTHLMTACTFGSSFLIAFVVMILFRSKKRARA